MLREMFKWKHHEDLSTDAEHRGGVARSSDEGAAMALERRRNTVRQGRDGEPFNVLQRTGVEGKTADCPSTPAAPWLALDSASPAT